MPFDGPGPGRNTLLTPELADKIVLHVRTGVPLEVAAQAAGIGRSTFWGWMRRGEQGAQDEPYLGFSQRVRTAEAETHMQLAAVPRNAAIQGGNWQAAQAYMRMRWSNHYAERIEHTGAAGGPIQMEIAQALESLTEDELAAIEAHLGGAAAPAAPSGPGGDRAPEEGP